MPRDKFPPGVAEILNWYVYRLIDPRNGETFYLGKGQGDRIFEHAKGALSESKNEESDDLKSQRIKDIRAVGLDVGHVIHRYNIEKEDVAFQIEAALIDAYPGLTNKVRGQKSNDYGCRHVEEIIREYTAQPFKVSEPLILISIGRSYYDERLDIYEAVRGVWRINKKRAEKFNLVLARRGLLILGAFRPNQWLEATKVNFPLLDNDIEGRWGFEGSQADEEIQENYVGKRVPDEHLNKIIRNPINYIELHAV